MDALRRTGIPLRPVVPGHPIVHGGAHVHAHEDEHVHEDGNVHIRLPRELLGVPELRLLGDRLGRSPSLGQACAAIGQDEGLLVSCLGQPLGPPLEQAFITEQVDRRTGKVVAVTAEESRDDAAAARKRCAGLAAGLGRPAPAGGQRLQVRARGFTVTLELLPDVGGTARVYLEIRTS